MASLRFQGHSVHTCGDLPAVGSHAPDFTLVGKDLGDITLQSFHGNKVLLNIFPSIDTPTCAASVRQFNDLATQSGKATVLCVSQDLPFALARFCGAEGIDGVEVASSFRSTFADDYGVLMTDSPLQGLMARAIVVVDGSGRVSHAQLVPNLQDEPDYESALAAINRNN